MLPHEIADRIKKLDALKRKSDKRKAEIRDLKDELDSLVGSEWMAELLAL